MHKKKNYLSENNKKFYSIKQIHDIINKGRLALHVTELGWGGTERYVEDLSIEYSRLGLNPLVIVDSPPLIRKNRIEAEGVEVICLKVSPSIHKREYKKILGTVLRNKNVKLLHSNPWKRWEWIQKICTQNKIYCIFTRHCTDRVPSFWQFINIAHPRGLWKFWTGILMGRRIQPAMISISHRSCKALRWLWGENTRTMTVYLGVPPPARRASPEERGQGPVFTWVGSFIPRKRPFLLLRAFSKLIEDFPAASLVVAGDGPLRKEVEMFAEETMPGKVTFLGFINNVELTLSQSQVFVLTSNNEGLSYVNLEAMSVGLPVITTDCGAVTEAVVDNETGLVVPVDDEAALVHAMKKLAGDIMLRKSMGISGYKRWRKLFTLDHMVNNTLEAYRSLLNI